MLRRWSMITTFSSDFKRLLTAWATPGFAYSGLHSVLFGLYILRLGFDIEFIGLALATGQVLWGLGSIPAGAIGRRFGLRRAMMLGFAGDSIVFALLLLVQLLPEPMRMPWVFVNYVLWWLFGALFTVNIVPYVMALTTPEERSYAFASQSLVSTISRLAGALLAGVLPGLLVALFGGSPLFEGGVESGTPYAITLALVPVSYAVGCYLLLGIKEVILADHDPADEARPAQSGAPYGFFVLLGAIVALLAIGSGAPQAFFTIYLDTEFDAPTSLIGLVVGISQLLPILVALIIPQILDRLGAQRTLMLMGGALALALVILGAATHWFIAAFGFATNVAVVVIVNTAQNLFSQENVPAQWRSISAAVINMGLAVGWATSAALGGLLVEALGMSGYFYLCAGIVLMASVLLVAQRLWWQSRPQVVPVE